MTTVYSRNSFDRFNDDLCEVLLKYLPLTDKFKFECIDKQWKRCVFVKQYTLMIVNFRLNYNLNLLSKLLLIPKTSESKVKTYAIVLKKLKYLKSVQFCSDGCNEILDLLANNCEFLTSLKFVGFEINETRLISFGEKCGKRLENLELTSNNIHIDYKKFLHLCPNLKSIYLLIENSTTSKISTKFIRASKVSKIIVDKDANYLSKLNAMKCYFYIDNNYLETLQLWNIFVDKYSEQLKVLPFYSNCNDNQINKQIIDQLAKFKNLEEIKLNFDNTSYEDNYIDISDQIKLIARNCTKIMSLYFNSSNRVLLDNIFESIALFRNLVQLKLNIYENPSSAKRYNIIEPFKECKRLKCFTIHYEYIDENFVENIPKCLPNLVSISLNSTQELSDNSLIHLSNLRDLRKIKISKLIVNSGTKFNLITDTGVCKLINCCENLRNIRFKSRPNITKHTIDALINATNSRHIGINFCFSHYLTDLWIRGWTKDEFVCQHCDNTLDLIQRNKVSNRALIRRSSLRQQIDKVKRLFL